MVIVAVVSFSSMTLILPFEKITKSQKVEINDNAGNHTKLTVIDTSVSQVLAPVVYSSYLLGFLGNMAFSNIANTVEPLLSGNLLSENPLSVKWTVMQLNTVNGTSIN